MAYDPNNVFARILRGELPCVKVYEDDLTLSFLDIMPSVEGHTLVIPKEPAEGILDLSAEGAAALIATTQKVARAVKKGLEPAGMMLLQLNGAAAGQTIPHIHFHILPRSEGLSMSIHGRAMVKPEVLEPIAAKIPGGTMILEVAILNVKSGKAAAFETAMREARPLLEASPGFQKMEVRACVETRDRYVLLVWWSSVEAHTQGFRQSERYAAWREKLHHFYDPFPVVQHYGVPL